MAFSSLVILCWHLKFMRLRAFLVITDFQLIYLGVWRVVSPNSWDQVLAFYYTQGDMAAGHQKKRWSASNVVSSNLQEQYRAKKKRALDSQRTVLNMRPHIHLKWDATGKEAVPKREQIGITFRDMDSFLDSIPGRHQGLADVFCIPDEIFDLDNLAQVLSYEV